MFYTRIPCPSNIDHNEDALNKASRYFSLIGWIVGGFSFLVFHLSSFLFGQSIAVILSLAAGILITGAFHEDGFADVVDGFGGGWTKQQILDIMKDSRLGAFGAIAISILLLLKYSVLNSLLLSSENWYLNLLIFISYHSLARLTSINIVFTSQYSREDEKSKAKPIAKSVGLNEIIGAYFFGTLPLTLLIYHNWQFIFIAIPLFILYYRSKKYFEKFKTRMNLLDIDYLNIPTNLSGNNITIMRDLWFKLKEDRYREIKQKITNFKYILTEDSHKLDFPVIFSNQNWIIYEIN